MKTEFDSQITFLYTRNLKATAEFYEEKLNLHTVLEQGGCRIYKTAGQSFLGFCERVETGTPDGVIFTLVTEDVDGWFEKLRSEGVSFEKEPVFNPDYNIYHCFFRDPNGYLIELQRFEDPRWIY
ncbi:MAG: VOC family protein [Candidatus Aegiribacteria sp.]|nr:VOC family protein [Candidatus Aegiribacteria sp.]